MCWYQYLSLVSLAVCTIACLWHLFRLIKKGNPKDLSKKNGNILKAEVYSYTRAMLPTNKETAYLHIPTFTIGVFFHIGTFVGLILFIIFFFVSPFDFPYWLNLSLRILLIIGTLSGLLLFVKRAIVRKLRLLSNPDDYLSNLFTTIFQCFTISFLTCSCYAPYYYVMVSILLLYIPVGKLRHIIYFFAARYHLGFFYGWRNSWPPQK
jgi:hypothetical protein